ncbi:MAG: hypothetical protein KAR21_19985 [Spirochaetales bacterium]|nr:hypothetical protein [Spirochaetales bacterium]
MERNTVLWIPGVIRKISILLFYITAVVFLIFLIGSFQEFLDSTQLILLNIFEIVAGVFILSGIYHIIITTAVMISSKSHAFISLGITLAGEAIVISFFILVNMIIAITKTVN